jgi:hypothetical protein
MANLSYQVNKNINSATKGVAIVADTPFSPCIAVNCATAGASTVTWLDDTTSSLYFIQGYNPVQIKNVAGGGAAAGLVALYNT